MGQGGDISKSTLVRLAKLVNIGVSEPGSPLDVFIAHTELTALHGQHCTAHTALQAS